MGRDRGAAGRRDPDLAHAQARRHRRASRRRSQARRRSRRPTSRSATTSSGSTWRRGRRRRRSRPASWSTASSFSRSMRRWRAASSCWCRPPASTLELDRARGRAPAADARPRSTARASPASRRWACRSCSPSAPRCRRSNTCRRCGRRAGVSWRRWARYLGEELHDASRSSPELREQARRIARAGPRRPGGGRRALAAALVDWVTDEHRGGRRARRSGELRAGARAGQPHRAGAGAGARAGHPGAARCWCARGWSPTRRRRTPPQELDDFADALVELDVGAPGKPVLVYADLRLRHAAFGYLPPGPRRRAHAARPGRQLRRRAQDGAAGSAAPST